MARRMGFYAMTALKVLALSGGIAALMLFPGLSLVAKEFLHSHKRYARGTMRRALRRLARGGYVRVVEEGDEITVGLTREGRKALERSKLHSLCIPKPAKWDGLWHIVAFDIPEKRSSARGSFRDALYCLGFTKIQKSVFIHPYPCERELATLAAAYHIGPFLHVITAASLNGEKKLAAKYQLTR